MNCSVISVYSLTLYGLRYPLYQIALDGWIDVTMGAIVSNNTSGAEGA